MITQCKLEIKWNGTPVMRAECSRVMAYQVLVMMLGEFVNAEKAGLTVPSLSKVYNAFTGEVFTGKGDDGTGSCEYVLEILPG